jgi:alpha-amylase
MVVQQQLQMRILCLIVALVGCGDVSQYGGAWRTSAGEAGDWRDEVIYQLLVDRFGNGDLNNDVSVIPGALGRYQGGDWQGVIDHLDYLQKLGVTALWISPIIRNLDTDANFDAYHGYWQQDFEHVNPHFGDLAKLRELVAKAHAKNFKVILDIVTNHVAQLFYYDINGNGAPDDEVYGSGCGVASPMNVMPCPTNPPLITQVNEFDPPYSANGVLGWSSLGFSGPAPVRWIWDPPIDRMPTLPGANAGMPNASGFNNLDWYHKRGEIFDYGQRDQVLNGDFPGGLKDLATERDDVRAALTAVFAKWIQAADFDGFRIDTLKHVEHEFWQYFCPRIRQYCAGKVDLPDPFGGPNAVVPHLNVAKQKFFMFGESFDGDDGLDSSYTLNQEVDSVFYFPQKFSVFDAVFKYGGATSQIEAQFNRKQALYASTPNDDGIGVPAQGALVNFMDNHDVPRFLFDKPSLPALYNALGFLFTEDGIPCVYYGTEQEFAGGNDPDNRERLWQTNFVTNGATFQYMAKLIAIRKAYSPLRRGTMAVRWSTDHVGTEEDANLFAFERTDGAHTVLVVLNTSDTGSAHTANGGTAMMTSFAAGTALTDVLSGDPAANVTVGAGGAASVSLGPRAVQILVPTTDVVPLP